MKGARRTRKPRQAGFADLMTTSPSSNSLRGVVTGVSRAQRSTPPTPNRPRPPSHPSTPPPLDDDWGALLQTTPKRRISPQKPLTPTHTRSRSASSSRSPSLRSPTTPSPRRTTPTATGLTTPPRSTTPRRHSFSPPAATSNKSTPPSAQHHSVRDSTFPSPATSSPVPAFLSGWDGADGWGDDPTLDDSDHETHDPWGVWTESEDLLSAQSAQDKDNLVASAAKDRLKGGQAERDDAHAAKLELHSASEPMQPIHQSNVSSEQTVTTPIADLAPVHDHTAPQTAVPQEEPLQQSTDEGHVTSTSEEVQPDATHAAQLSQQPGSVVTPSENAINTTAISAREEHAVDSSREETQLPKAEPEAPVGFDDFSGWAVEESPQAPVAEFSTSDPQRADATQSAPVEDASIPVIAQDDQRLSEADDVRADVGAPAATEEAQVPESEPESATGFDDFSGWDVEVPPQEPVAEFQTPDPEPTAAAQRTTAQDTVVPVTMRANQRLSEADDVRADFSAPAVTEKAQVPENEPESAAGFDDFSGWDVEGPPQEPVAEFPTPDPHQADATQRSLTQDTVVPVITQHTQGLAEGNAHADVIAPTGITEEAQVPKNEPESAAGFDAFSGWTVEEPPQVPAAEFPIPDTEQADAAQSATVQDATSPVVARDAQRLSEANAHADVSAPTFIEEPQVPKNGPESSASFDAFSGWTVEEPPQAPVAEFPTPDLRKDGAAQSATVGDATIPAITPDTQRFSEVDSHGIVSAPSAVTEVKAADSQAVSPFEVVADAHRDASETLTAEPSTQPDRTQTSQSVDLWAFDEASEEVPTDDGGWGWGEPAVVPPVQPEPVQKLETSEPASVPVSSNVISETPNTSATIPASMPMSEQRADASLEKTVEAAPPMQQHDSATQQPKVDNVAPTAQRTTTETEWEMNEGAMEVNLDDWGWGAQADEEAVDFNVGVNAIEGQANGPPQSAFAHSSTTLPPTKASPSFVVDSFHEKEEGTINNDQVSTNQREQNSNAATAHISANTDFSMYAPKRERGEPENDELAQGQRYSETQHAREVVTEDRLSLIAHGDEARYGHDGTSGNKYVKEGLGEQGRATQAKGNPWTSDTGFSNSTGPMDWMENVETPTEAGPQTKRASGVIRQDEREELLRSQANPSNLWSEYEETAQSQADRSWTNPDAIWSSSPVPPTSTAVAGSENKKDSNVRHEDTRQISASSRDAVAPDQSGIPPPRPSSNPTSRSVEAQDMSTFSFEDSVPYAPIQQEMFQHYSGELPEANVASEGAINGSESNANKALGMEPGPHDLQSTLQPQQVATSGVSDSAQPQRPTQPNAYWAERLDQSRSSGPESSGEPAPQRHGEHQNTEHYTGPGWSPNSNASRTEPSMKSDSYSEARPHSQNASASQMNEYGSELWSSSTNPRHPREPQTLQWSTPLSAQEPTDASDRHESAQKLIEMDRDVDVRAKEDRRETAISEHGTVGLMNDADGVPSDWNQYAPRGNRSGHEVSPPTLSSHVDIPLPTEQPASEPQDAFNVVTGGVPEVPSYAPFSVNPDEATVDEAENSHEAFDWGFGTQASSQNSEVIPPAVPNVESRKLDGAGAGLHQDMPQGARPYAHGVELQSNMTPATSAPNGEYTNRQPQIDDLHGAFCTQNTFRADGSQASNDWSGVDQESISNLQEQRFSKAQNGSNGDSAGILLESFEHSPRADSLRTAQPGIPRVNEPMTRNSVTDNNHDETALSAHDPESSNGNIVLDSFAPPTVTAKRYPAEYLPRGTREDGFEAFNVEENRGDVSQTTAPAEPELRTKHVSPEQEFNAPYQAPTTKMHSSYPPGLSYAPSVPPVTPQETLSSDGSGYLLSGQKATESTFPPASSGMVPSIEQTPADTVTFVSQPSSQPPIPEHQGQVSSSNMAKSSLELPDKNINERNGGLSSYDLNAVTQGSIPSQDHGIPALETDANAMKGGSDPWSSYGPSTATGGSTVSRETTSIPWDSSKAAYNDMSFPAQDQLQGYHSTNHDDASHAYGSHIVPDVPSLDRNIPPPPQQVPFIQPPYSGEQDIYQMESIVDPSAFSYPYSIMDTEISGDFSTRRPRPIISWGFGGKLVTVTPRMNASSEGDVSSGATGLSTVHIHDLKDIAQDGSNDDWAAASEAIPPPPSPVQNPDLSAYAEMCERLSKLSAGLKGTEADGRAALWRMLSLLCRKGTTDWRVDASSAICGPSSVPMFGRNDSSSLLPGNSKMKTPLREDQLDCSKPGLNKTEAATEVERLLTLGKGREAIQVAQEAGLWSIALVLAGTMDRSLYLKMVSGYAKSVLHDGSALQTLCLSVAEDESEILRKATSPAGLKEWRKTVGMLLTTARSTPSAGDGPESRFLRLIDRIGEALITQNNDIVAGHVCFLVSGRLGPLDGSDIQLLGADPKLPAGRPRALGSAAVALQSLVLEAAGNGGNWVTYPHLLPHRLVLAEEICSVGKPDVALAHCESISSAVRSIFESGRQDIASKWFTLPFLSRLESLEQRLRVHLGKVDLGERKGRLTALGKSLSSVFKKTLTTESRNGESMPQEKTRDGTQFIGSGNTSSLQAVPGPSASPPLPPVASSDYLPNSSPEVNWTPKLDAPTLEPHVSNQSSSSIQTEPPANDVSGNERWNSLVSKTIGFLAPAEGDLSPPLKARNDQGVPLHAQPTPLGLGSGMGSRLSTLDQHAGHMRSASVGDVPLLQRQEPFLQTHGQSNYSHPAIQESQSQTDNNRSSNQTDQTNFNGVPVHRTTAAESNMSPTHRRAASDMTFESQTSEKKPPRPPKKSPTLPSGVELQPKREKAQAAKGWRSRLSEKIRAAFSGPPRAHMGVENKFKFNKELGRWVIEGEDPDEGNDEPPPPPEDDPVPDLQMTVPYSQSYESLPNPDTGNNFSSEPPVAAYQSDNEFGRERVQAESFRRYSHAGQVASSNTPADNIYSRDTGSESSIASAASAPVPYSSQPAPPMLADPGNKFRARPGRMSGRRAYIDTFNKGTPAVATSAAFPNPARPRPPTIPGLGPQAGGAYRIFTPSPAISSQGSNGDNSSVPGDEGGPVISNTVQSNENMYQKPAEIPTSDGPEGSSFGYGFPNPAPSPSVEQYQRNARKDHQPRLMA